jgi:hypothetical protein
MAVDAVELAEVVEGAQAAAVAAPTPMGAVAAVLTTIRNRKWHSAIGLAQQESRLRQ